MIRRFAKCFEKRMNDFLGRIEPLLRSDADILLEYTTCPNKSLYSTRFKTGTIKQNMWLEMGVFPHKDIELKGLHDDYNYLGDVASCVVEAMAKTIAKHAPKTAHDASMRC